MENIPFKANRILLLSLLTCSLITNSIGIGHKAEKESLGKKTKIPEFKFEDFESSTFYEKFFKCWHLAFKYAHNDEGTNITREIYGEEKSGMAVNELTKDCINP